MGTKFKALERFPQQSKSTSSLRQAALTAVIILKKEKKTTNGAQMQADVTQHSIKFTKRPLFEFYSLSTLTTME